MIAKLAGLVGFMQPLSPVRDLDVADPLAWFFYWLGLSIGMHAFPSTQDLSNIKRLAGPAARAGNLYAILAHPLLWLLYVANALRFFWAHYAYGLLIGALLPLAVFRWFI